MDRKEYAVNLKSTGCNCAQSVLLAFSEETGMPEEELRKLGAAFGAGMGSMEATCGALVGAGILTGILKYQGRPIIRDAAALQKQFCQMCGATICKELKGRDTGVVLCACDDCIRNAVSIMEHSI